jgi:hypothetical protein
VERRTAYLLAGGTVLGLGAFWLASSDELGGVAGEAAQAVNDALNAIVKGSRLTHAPYDKTTGVVPGDPEDLAAAAGLDVETNSLARLISSEEGRSSNAVKLAVAWAVQNHALRLGKTITALLTRANEPTHAGYYGTQKNIDAATSGYGRSDRYASTALDPYEGDAAIAKAVTSMAIDDPTGGAEYFDRPAGENAEKVAANRAADGLVLADVAGVDPDADGIRFWRAA